MVKPIVKPLEDVVSKWVEEAPKRSPYYEKYTPAAADRWEERAKAADKTYKSAVTAPGIEKRFRGGIARVGAAKFRRKVTAVGVPRYGPGIEAARDDYKVGVDPFLAEIAATDIPVRKPRGDPANWERSKKIGLALHKKRLAILAALPAS